MDLPMDGLQTHCSAGTGAASSRVLPPATDAKGPYRVYSRPVDTSDSTDMGRSQHTSEQRLRRWTSNAPQPGAPRSAYRATRAAGCTAGTQPLAVQRLIGERF